MQEDKLKEELIFISRAFIKEKRKLHNLQQKINKLKGFYEIEDFWDSFSGRSYINLKYSGKTIHEIQSIISLLNDL